MGRLRVRVHSTKELKQNRELKKLAHAIKTPQEFALMLMTVSDPVKREMVKERIRPYLRFKLESIHPHSHSQEPVPIV